MTSHSSGCARSLSADASATERLRREAQVVSRLDHPRIVRLFDLITDGADLVLVMEYVRGPSVQSMAAAARPSASQALAVVSDVAEALDYAASRGVVHRDVKPANVFITATGRCKLGDFGLARISGERLRCSCRMTGQFAAHLSTWHPSIARRGTNTRMGCLRARADGDGAVIGRHPFAGMSVRGAVEAHLDGGAVSAAAVSALPAPVVAVLRRGLASLGADRPTASQLAEHLVEAAPTAWFGVTADHVHSIAVRTCRTRGPWVPTWGPPMVCGRAGSGPAGPSSWSMTRHGSGRPSLHKTDRRPSKVRSAPSRLRVPGLPRRRGGRDADDRRRPLDQASDTHPPRSRRRGARRRDVRDARGSSSSRHSPSALASHWPHWF